MTQMTFSRTGILLLALLAAGGAPAESQTEGGKPIPLTVTGEQFILYPSMEPETAIRVSLGNSQQVYDAIKSALAAGWDCAKTSSYLVSVTGTSDAKPRNVPVADVGVAFPTSAAGDDGPRGKCLIGNRDTVYLVIRSSIRPAETIQVTLQNLPDKSVAIRSDGKLTLAPATVYNVLASPQAAPGEKLINGKTRDVGQLDVSLSDSNLFPDVSLPFNVYAKSTDLFSTDERDTKSAFTAVLGEQRGLFTSWYAPIHLEEGVQGNQIATNLSAITTLGITAPLPWTWATPLLNNSFVNAPLSPDITIDNQYTNRLRQYVAPGSKPLATNDYSANPFLSWSSITFPWTCRIFSWLSGAGSQPPAPAAIPSCGVGVAIDLGLYYLPLDLTASKSQRVEGYGDISILIPLKSLAFASNIFPYLTTGNTSQSRIRIEYSDAVAAANNYARTREWTYGIELIK